MKLDVKAFALTCALLWGPGLLLVTWWVIALDGASANPTWLGHVYRGYNLTIAGSVIGAIWAFFDGLIGGAIFAGLYNYIDAHATVRRRMAA